MNPKECLEHIWLKNEKEIKFEAESKVDPLIINLLKDFQPKAKLKKEVLKIIAKKMINEKELRELRKAFVIIDKNKTGYISSNELKKSMNDLGFKESENEIKLMMKEFQLDDNDIIKYTDFLTATLDKKIHLTKEKVDSAFKYFDIDNSNFITISNLKEVLARFLLYLLFYMFY